MTLPASERRSGPYAGNDAQTVFPFGFTVADDDELLVTFADSDGVERTLVLDSDYSVTRNGNQEVSPGGTITYPLFGADNLTTTQRLVIEGDTPYDQPLDIPDGGNFRPDALEAELDRIVTQIQQIRLMASRSMRLGATVSNDVSALLPIPKAGNILAWSQAAQSLINVDPETFGPILINNADSIAFTPEGDDAVVDSVGNVLRRERNVKDFGVLGNGVTDDSEKLMAAASFLAANGGGELQGNAGDVYLVANLWPRNGVKLNLRGATLKLKDNLTGGLYNVDQRIYDPSGGVARVDFRNYIPGNVGYTGGHYAMAGSLVEIGSLSVFTATPADAANFTPGSLCIVMGGTNGDSKYVAESNQVESSNSSTGEVTLRWPLHKRFKNLGPNFGIAKRDAGYISGEGSGIVNGVIDAGEGNDGIYVLSYEGMKMEFDGLRFKGRAGLYYNIRGTKCRLTRARMERGVIPYSIDQGSTDNTIAFCHMDMPQLSGDSYLHLGEPHSDTKFLYNTIAFKRATTPLTGPGQQGITGLTAIGNTFINPPGDFIGGDLNEDGGPISQIWALNNFTGHFAGFMNVNGPSAADAPTQGGIIFHYNFVFGTYDSTLNPRGPSANMIGALKYISIMGNTIYVTDTVAGKINTIAAGDLDVDTTIIKDNRGIPDLQRIVFGADDAKNLSGATLTAVNGFPLISYADAAADTAEFRRAPQVNGGKVIYKARTKWANLGAGSGNIRARLETNIGDVGVALGSSPVQVDFTVTVGAQNVPVASSVVTIAQNGYRGDFFQAKAYRLGSDGADTLGNAAGLLSLEVFAVPLSGY